MITLMFAAVTNSSLLEVLGLISAALESCAALVIIVTKAVITIRSKELTDKEKLEQLNQISKKK